MASLKLRAATLVHGGGHVHYLRALLLVMIVVVSGCALGRPLGGPAGPQIPGTPGGKTPKGETPPTTNAPITLAEPTRPRGQVPQGDTRPITISGDFGRRGTVPRNLYNSFSSSNLPPGAPTLESFLRSRFGTLAAISSPGEGRLSCQVEGIQKEVFREPTYKWESLILEFILLGTYGQDNLRLVVHSEGHYAQGLAPPQTSEGYTVEIPRVDLEAYTNRLLSDIRRALK